MIIFTASIEEFKNNLQKIGANTNAEAVAKLDFPFFEKADKHVMVSIPTYDDSFSQNMIYLSKKNTIVFSKFISGNNERMFKPLIAKQYGESTVITYSLLKSVLRNYSHEFEKIRDIMNMLDLNPVLDKIEDSGRALRKLTDRLEEVVQIMIVLKENEIKEFNSKLLPSEYELLSAETRYLLERCRSHIYRIASLRTKSEMRSNRQLNTTMRRLTAITTFLAIVSIVVSVPGTIGAIFGIPALSDAYFRGHTTLLTWTLISSTLLSVALGYLYWKSLRL